MTTTRSETEMRILSEIEEAGEQDARALLNTILDPVGTSTEVTDFQTALRSLLDAELIEIAMDSIPTGLRALDKHNAMNEIDSIGSYYKFSDEQRIWQDSRENGPPYFQIPLPTITSTDTGDALASDIVDERGYRWWITNK